MKKIFQICILQLIINFIVTDDYQLKLSVNSDDKQSMNIEIIKET